MLNYSAFFDSVSLIGMNTSCLNSENGGKKSCMKRRQCCQIGENCSVLFAFLPAQT